MIGTILNCAAILVGSAAGLLLGSRFPEKLRTTIIYTLGLFTLALGLKMFLETGNALIVLASLILGGILGELIHLEDLLEQFGSWLEVRFSVKKGDKAQSDFSRAFITTSLLTCVGPVAVLGSIQEGLSGNYQLLAVKSILDGVSSIAFAASLGVGVAFSAVPLFIYQGSITILAGWLNQFITDAMLNELTATGGVLMLAIAISSLLEIRKIRTGNLLPALFFAPLLTGLITMLGISLP